MRISSRKREERKRSRVCPNSGLICYESADFPVALSFLPNREATEFEGYQVLQTDEEVKTGEKPYRQYLTKITIRLENISPDEYQPDLRYFEQVISTLKIENAKK